MTRKKKILVLCTGNSCRSQIAEGYLRYFAGEKAEIFSAGVETHGVNPRAVATMLEDGIDLSSHRSKNVSAFKDTAFDFVITVCDHANEVCPVFPGTAQKFHHNFADPAKVVGSEEQINEAFRRVREEIKIFCRAFVTEHLNA